LMPTFLEAAGVKDTGKIELHGRSILGYLEGGSFHRGEALHWETQENAATLLDDWKLVERYWMPHPFLYHLTDDPYEKTDLSEKYPDKVRDLLALHAEWKARHYPNPIPRHDEVSRYEFPEEPVSDSKPVGK